MGSASLTGRTCVRSGNLTGVSKPAQNPFIDLTRHRSEPFRSCLVALGSADSLLIFESDCPYQCASRSAARSCPFKIRRNVLLRRFILVIMRQSMTPNANATTIWAARSRVSALMRGIVAMRPLVSHHNISFAVFAEPGQR